MKALFPRTALIFALVSSGNILAQSPPPLHYLKGADTELITGLTIEDSCSIYLVTDGYPNRALWKFKRDGAREWRSDIVGTAKGYFSAHAAVPYGSKLSGVWLSTGRQTHCRCPAARY